MKLNSLKKNHIFSKAYKKGQKAVRKSVCVYCLKNFRPQSETYLGITVSTKLGGAVQRNRAKRVIRAAYRELIARCPRFAGNYFIVAVARSGCYDGSLKSGDVSRDLESAFRELGIISGEKQ
ncbi:MAG: ribonuclease P protein component [Clostridia bacterium]|nr:ribonuclease P protein component [Clostridia bacterium]